MAPDPEGAIFVDRLTNKRAELPTGPGVLLGRWVLDIAAGIMNSQIVQAGDFLVPDRAGRFVVVKSDGKPVRGTIAKLQMPDDPVAESVLAIGAQVDEVLTTGGNWEAWLEIVPLVPRVEEHLRLTELDVQIEQTLGSIEAVCHNPATHLKVDLERVPVSRARRVPAKAASYLAAHTEDWARRKLYTIEPRRVQAEIRDELFDIYENRIVARLIDNLLMYIEERIRRVKRLIRLFEEREDFGSEVTGTHQRARRIAALWGELVNASEGREKARATLQKLESAKYRLLSLRGSQLYKEVSRQAVVSSTLKTTNLLSNHQQYRRVANLWRAWALMNVTQQGSLEDHLATMQQLCRSFDNFVLLLLLRALDDLGFAPHGAPGSKSVVPGRTTTWRGWGLTVEVTPQDDGTVSIEANDQTLRVVGLASDVGAGSASDTRTTAKGLASARQEQSDDSLVLYLASVDQQKTIEVALARALHNVGNDPWVEIDAGRYLPVSPWEIGSIERVGRALRWFLFTGSLKEYPFEIDIPEALTSYVERAGNHSWLSADIGRSSLLVVIRPPSDEELQDFRSSLKLGELETEVVAAHSELEAAAREVGRSKGSERAKHAHAEKVARSRLSELTARQSQVHDLLKALERIQRAAGSMLSCPTCRKEADPRFGFAQLDNGCFRCSCDDCGTVWGLNLCSGGHRFEYMLPNGKWPTSFDDYPGWIDKTFGGDILALPAVDATGDWGYVCPTCGLVS